MFETFTKKKMELCVGAKPLFDHQKTKLAGLGCLALLSLSGCSDMITANSLGVDKVATNRCLVNDQVTNEGIVIPRGTKGYLQENLGRESFVITNNMTGLPTAYDITGQQRSMRSCSGTGISNSSIITAAIGNQNTSPQRPVQVAAPQAIPPRPVQVSTSQTMPARPTYRPSYPANPPIPPMPIQPYPVAQSAQHYPSQAAGYGTQRVYQPARGYMPVQSQR